MKSLTLQSGITIERIVVGPLANNVWIIRQSEGPSILIDCADEPGAIEKLIGKDDISVIITTHRHPDHIGALHAIASPRDADNLAGTPDCDAIFEVCKIRPDGIWTDDVIQSDNIVLNVIGLVGHTPGSIALALEQPTGPTHIFTGDSLFPGGVGKTHSPEDFAQLIGDVEEKIFDQYPDDTVILPGHGESTTLGAERPQLPDWHKRGW